LTSTLRYDSGYSFQKFIHLGIGAHRNPQEVINLWFVEITDENAFFSQLLKQSTAGVLRVADEDKICLRGNDFKANFRKPA